jgi:polyisoprenoid-binding protein YceI
MMIPPGEYRIGPPYGWLVLRTFREGVASKVGHDLVIEVTRWQGMVAVPADGGMPRVAVEVDMGSLEVREGVGGVKPLTDRDRDEIKRHTAELLRTAEYPRAIFQSTGVAVDRGAASIDGSFTLAGVSQPLRLAVQANGDRTVTASGEVQQTRWGITPYKGFMGALKIRDNVVVEATIPLAG